MAPFPARIHVLLARDTEIGVVMRRGPSKQVCTLLWNRRKDEFTIAQWLKGRIYERRSDLSPDGKYLIYFAMNGKWNSETGGSWTAISRAPWLKAITLLGKGDCWHGGGLFTSNCSYWLNDGYGHQILKDSSEVYQDTKFRPSEYYGGECPGVYYVRLQRDGWTHRGHTKLHKLKALAIFEKRLQNGWVLRKIAHEEVDAPPGKGCYWDEHELENSNTGTLFKYPNWEWVEWDRNRLVWTSDGYLYAGDLIDSGLQNKRLIYDFNDLCFEALLAPY